MRRWPGRHPRFQGAVLIPRELLEKDETLEEERKKRGTSEEERKKRHTDGNVRRRDLALIMRAKARCAQTQMPCCSVLARGC